jgi:branched-chain amino acid transport system substrate-binding protein
MVAITFSVIGLILGACGSSKEDAPAATSDSGTKDTSPIEIAFIGDLSGPVAPYSKASLAGLKIAIDEANAAGGVDGRQLDLKSYDDTNDPIQTVNLSKRAAPSASAVVIASASSPVLAASPELDAAGVPFFVTVSSNAKVTTSGWKWVNRVHLSDADQVDKIVDHAVTKLKLKRIGMIYDTSDFGKGGLGLAQAAMKKRNVELVAEQGYNLGANDFSAQVNALRDAKLDGLLAWGDVDGVSRVTEQLKSLGVTNLQVLGGGGIVSNKFIELAGKAAEGAVASWAYVDPNNAVVKSMSDKYKTAEGRDVDVFAAQSYDAGRIIVQAVKTAGTSDKQKLQAAIRAIQYEGAVGKLSFDTTGQNVRQVRLGTVRDGKWTLLE